MGSKPGQVFGACARVFAWVSLFLAGTNVRAATWEPAGSSGVLLPNHDVISGQMNCVAVDPRDANRLYVGAASGGVWKTTDGGATWSALTDDALQRETEAGVRRVTTGIGCIALDPQQPDHVYAGTGEPNVATCCWPSDGLGVFRSMDAGHSWTALGEDLGQSGCENALMSGATVYKLAVLPTSPKVVIAATNRGVMRYRDDGSDCWVRLTGGLPPALAVAMDLVCDPVTGTLYVGIQGRGVFASLDPEGQGWRTLRVGPTPAEFGRVSLAFAGRVPSDRGLEAVVYVGIETPNADRYRLFVSKDGGDSWNELPQPPNDGQQGFNLALAAPDPRTVYVGQIGLWRATDGGQRGGLNDYETNPPRTDRSWTNMSCCLSDRNGFRTGLDLHADLHDIVFAPEGSFAPSTSQAEILFVATDGGITKGIINDVRAIYWRSITRGLSVGQCGTVGVDPSDPLIVAYGVWHNGTNIFTAGVPESAAPLSGGDGFHAKIDAGGHTIYFNCNAGYGGAVCRAQLAPHTFDRTDADPPIWSSNAVESGGPWADPYHPGHLLLVQGGRLVRNTSANGTSAPDLDRSSAWTNIGPAGMQGSPSALAFEWLPLSGGNPYYAFGTTAGQVWCGSPERGWALLYSSSSTVTGISADSSTPDRLVASFTSTESPGRIKELRRTSNGGCQGPSWQARNVDQAFRPELQVKSVTTVLIDPLDPTTVYVGTDQGLWQGTATSDPWAWTRSIGTPGTWIMDLRPHQGGLFQGITGSVYVATFGRGIFQLATPQLIAARRGKSPGRNPEGAVRGSRVKVFALGVGSDGPAAILTSPMSVRRRTQIEQRVAPFSIILAPDSTLTIECPRTLGRGYEEMRFIGWWGGQVADSTTTFRALASRDTTLIAYFRPATHARTAPGERGWAPWQEEKLPK